MGMGILLGLGAFAGGGVWIVKGRMDGGFQ